MFAQILDLPPPIREATARMDPIGFKNQIGAVAQLVERVVRNDEVRGSIPLSSTIRNLVIPAKAGISLFQ